MQVFDFSDGAQSGNYYVDSYGDIHDTPEDAQAAGHIVARLIVPALYVGSADEMRQHWLREYTARTTGARGGVW